MKASTFFAVSVAVLLGMTAVAGAKYLGIFDKKTVVVPDNQPPQILVAAQNLHENIAITDGMVRTRPMRQDEYDHWKQNRDKYLPPLVAAAMLRIPLKAIEADQPLFRSHFKELGFPENTSGRLEAGMVAVNLALPKERAAGGLIQTGERVDVMLTTKICNAGDCDQAVTKTAYIARGLKVIIKRNTLYTILAAVPDDRPVVFSLQANPYRAALIEFAHLKGDITLVPVAATSSESASRIVAVNSVDGAEYREDEQRSAALVSGESSIGDADLERIFKLKAVVRKDAPPPVVIRRISGVSVQGELVFGQDGRVVSSPSDSRPQSQGQTALGYQFHSPGTSLVARNQGKSGSG